MRKNDFINAVFYFNKRGEFVNTVNDKYYKNGVDIYLSLYEIEKRIPISKKRKNIKISL
jgi:hypothetical protein